MSEQIPSSISRASYQAPEPLRKSNENLGSTAMRPLAGRDSQQFGMAGLKPTGPPLPLKKSNEQVAASSTDQNLANSGLRPVSQRQSLQLGTAGLKPTGPPLPFKKSNENISQASAIDNTAISGLRPVANRQSFQPIKRSNEPTAQIAPQPAPRQNESFSGPPVPQRQSLQPPPRYSQTQPQLPARPDAAPPSRGHVRESSGLAPPVAPRKSPAPVRADQSFSQVTPVGGHLSNASNTSLAIGGKRITEGRFSFPADIPIPRQYPSGNAPSAGPAAVRLRDAPPPPPPSRR